MPKFDVILQPGEAIPDEFLPILEKRLNQAAREKLLKHGGLIRVSVASPYVDRKTTRPTAEINAEFIAKLESLSREEASLRAELKPLKIKELLAICKLIDLPTGSKASSREMRESILRRLQSSDVWDRIVRAKDPKTEENDSEGM